MTVYNMSKIKEWYEDFNSCKSNYLNNYYQNYKSSYIVTNNDSSVSKMQKKLDGYYSRLKNAYSKVGNAWKNLYNDLMNADAALAGQKSSGSVNASGASAKISSMPKLVEYKNDLGLTGAAGVSAIAAGTVAGVTYSAEQVQSQAIQTATLSTQAGVDQVSQSVSETTEASKGGVGKTLGFAAAGAATGAAIASVIPGIGTAIGGLVGAGVGALIGSGVVSKIKDWFVGVGETVKETAVDVKNKISSIKDEVEDTDGVLNKLKVVGSGAKEIGKKLAATGATIATSAVEGLAKLVEDVVDLVALVGTAVASVGTGVVDLANLAGAKITGNDSYKSDYTKLMWDKTRSFVATDHVGNAFDKFYDNTSVGKWIKENAIAFDTTRAITREISEVLGVIAITVLTAGVGGAVTGTATSVGAGISAAAASTAVTTTGAAITYGAVKTAEHTETNWQDENTSTFKGLTKGVLQGVADGAFFAIGAKGDQVLRKSATSVAKNLGKDATKEAIKAAQRDVTKKLGMKMAFEGATSVAQDFGTIGLDAIFSNDTVVDANGNTIKLNSMSEKLKYYYEQAGGAQGLAQSVMTAVALSGIADRSDSIKIVNKAVKQGEKTSFKQALHSSKLKTSYKLDQLKASANLKLTSGAIALTGKTIDLGKVVKNFTGDTISKVKNKIDPSSVKQKVSDSLSSTKSKLHSSSLKTSYKLDQLKASVTLKLTKTKISAASKVVNLGLALKNFTGDTISKVKNKLDSSAVKQKLSDSVSNAKGKISTAKNVVGGIGSNVTEHSKNKLKNVNLRLKNSLSNTKFKLSSGVSTLSGTAISLKNKLKASVDDTINKINVKKQAKQEAKQIKNNVKNQVNQQTNPISNNNTNIKKVPSKIDYSLNKTNFENSVNRKIDFLNRKINKLDDFKAKNNINLLIKNGDMPISELNGIKPSNIERYISQYKHNIESIKNLSFVDNVIMTNKEKSILDTLENVIKTMDDKYGESVGLNTIKRYINGSADLVNITSTNNCRQQISKYSREELLNVYKLRNNIEEAKLYATNLNVKNFSDKFSKFVSQDKIDKITENVIFTSSDAMTVFYRKGVNGFNDSLNSYVIINGNRTIENVKATTAHENLHAISWGRDSNGNLIAGVSISKKYTALNEAFTEYINKISFGENYPINRNSGYMGMVSRLKTLVDSGVVDNNDIQYAYFKNDISNLKNKIDSKAGDGYFDKIVDAFDNSWKNYTNNKMGNNSYLELDKLLMNLF